MTTEYDRVDVEAARFRMALLEDVGDPVDDLTLSIASMTPTEQDGPDSNPGAPIVLEGVVEVPESLLADSDVVASKVSEISDFARGLGVATRFKLEHPAPIDGGKLPATALSSPSAARDVFEMKGRYTRNLILPRGFALTWSKRGEKQLASIKADRAAREHASVESAQEQASELAAKPVTLTVKVGESGRLFGTVKAGDVAKAVAAAGLGTIDKRRIELPAHIKSVGKYTANVHVYDDVTAVVTLNVVAGHPTIGHWPG